MVAVDVDPAGVARVRQVVAALIENRENAESGAALRHSSSLHRHLLPLRLQFVLLKWIVGSFCV